MDLKPKMPESKPKKLITVEPILSEKDERKPEIVEPILSEIEPQREIALPEVKTKPSQMGGALSENKQGKPEIEPKLPESKPKVETEKKPSEINSGENLSAGLVRSVCRVCIVERYASAKPRRIWSVPDDELWEHMGIVMCGWWKLGSTPNDNFSASVSEPPPQWCLHKREHGR